MKRCVNTEGYRFGFNGKENDNEIKGTGNQQDYGMRIYDPRLGRFLSVDPLTKDYPWYSPYQFAGNSPIKFIDLDGLEPEKNPADYEGTREKLATKVVGTIADMAREANSSNNKKTTYSDQKLLGTAELTGKDSYVTDTNDKDANMQNLWVNTGSVFKVDESNSRNFQDYESFVVKEMMSNFVSGMGLENYNFPVNGIISSQFLDSDILKEALTEFRKQGSHDKNVPFGAFDLVKDAGRNGTLFNISGLVGSGIVTVTPNADGVAVSIFNITSLSSGAFGKELFCWNKEKYYPRSYVRQHKTSEPTPYGNISQTYNLQLSHKLIDKIIGQ